MTIQEAWENINHRLNEYVELSHSYSPRDNEAERIIEKLVIKNREPEADPEETV